MIFWVAIPIAIPLNRLVLAQSLGNRASASTGTHSRQHRTGCLNFQTVGDFTLLWFPWTAFPGINRSRPARRPTSGCAVTQDVTSSDGSLRSLPHVAGFIAKRHLRLFVGALASVCAPPGASKREGRFESARDGRPTTPLSHEQRVATAEGR